VQVNPGNKKQFQVEIRKGYARHLAGRHYQVSQKRNIAESDAGAEFQNSTYLII